jgi:hypothetical protein
MAAFLFWAAIGGILAAWVAWKARQEGFMGLEPPTKTKPTLLPSTATSDDDVPSDTSSSPTTTTSPPSTVYVIGDLHGDADCAKYWVDRLQLVDMDTQKWLQPEATLVFLGDYCDKGCFSYQTMHFVKSLTDAFPDHVTALMGNHELELLRDRDPSTQPKYMQYVFFYLYNQSLYYGLLPDGIIPCSWTLFLSLSLSRAFLLKHSPFVVVVSVYIVWLRVPFIPVNTSTT